MAETKIDKLRPGDFPGVSRPPSSETLFMFMNLANPDRVNFNNPRSLDRVLKLNTQKAGEEELYQDDDRDGDDDHDDHDDDDDDDGDNHDHDDDGAGDADGRHDGGDADEHGEDGDEKSKRGDLARANVHEEDDEDHTQQQQDEDQHIQRGDKRHHMRARELHADEGDDDDEDFYEEDEDDNDNDNDTGDQRRMGQGFVSGQSFSSRDQNEDDEHTFANANDKTHIVVDEQVRNRFTSPSASGTRRVDDEQSAFDWATVARKPSTNGVPVHHHHHHQHQQQQQQQNQQAHMNTAVELATSQGVPLGAIHNRRVPSPTKIAEAKSAVSASHISGMLNQRRRIEQTPPPSRPPSMSNRGMTAFDALVREQANSTEAAAGAGARRFVAQQQPVAMTLDDLKMSQGSPRSTASQRMRRKDAMRKIADTVEPGFFGAAVASQVNAIRNRRESGRSVEADSCRESVRRRNAAGNKGRSSRDVVAVHSDSESTSDSDDSDTDAYSENGHHNKPRDYDPQRPPDTDEEEYYYTLSEDQFKRWRARRDAKRMKEAKKRRKKRKKEKKAAEKRAKSAYIAQLAKLKLQGIPISREYTMDDALEDMRLEFERHQSCIAMIEKVETMRRTIGIVLTIAELLLCALRINVQGWASEVTKEMENKKYDPVLEKLYRKYWKRNAPSPEFSLALMIFGMMAMKWLQNREARLREAQGTRASVSPGASAGPTRPGIGGALSSVAQGVIGSLLGRGPGILGSILGGLSSSSSSSSPTSSTTTSTSNSTSSTSAFPSSFSASTSMPASTSPPSSLPPQQNPTMTRPVTSGRPNAQVASQNPASATVGSSPQLASPVPSTPSGIPPSSSEPWTFARPRRGVTPITASNLTPEASLPTSSPTPDASTPFPSSLPSPAAAYDPRAMAARAAEQRRQQSLARSRDLRQQMSNDEAAEQALQRARMMSGDV